MIRLKSIYAALARRLRMLAGLDEGETMHPLMVALYSLLGLTFLVLVLALITDTSLDCIVANCERRR